MTFEILISLYGIALLVYMPFVLIKVIRLRRADRVLWENYKNKMKGGINDA
jgi:hypothetical protein